MKINEAVKYFCIWIKKNSLTLQVFIFYIQLSWANGSSVWGKWNCWFFAVNEFVGFVLNTWYLFAENCWGKQNFFAVTFIHLFQIHFLTNLPNTNFVCRYNGFFSMCEKYWIADIALKTSMPHKNISVKLTLRIYKSIKSIVSKIRWKYSSRL